MKKITLKIKNWFFKILVNTFQRYWNYQFEYLNGINGDWIIVFQSPTGVSHEFRIPQMVDKTPLLNPEAYNPSLKTADAGWSFKRILLKTQKEVTLHVVANEFRLDYLENMKKIKEDVKKHPERFQHLPFEMDHVLDIDVKVVGDGSGLSKVEREEIVQFIKTADFNL